jgi:hypothetical protein
MDVSPNTEVDFILQGGSSLYILKPMTDAGVAWVEEHIGQDNGYQPYFPAVAIEHRYVGDILAGISADGLSVR